LDNEGNLSGTTVSDGLCSTICKRECGTVFRRTRAAGGSWIETVLYWFKGQQTTLMAILDSQSQADVPEFSLVRGGPFHKLRKILGVVPENDLGLARRTAILVAVVWLPIVIGAIVEKRLLPGDSPDPLLRHFGVHARMLVAIPLLIYAEAVMERIVPAIVRQFTLAGLVVGRTKEEFIQILRQAEALRDSTWGKLVVAGAILSSIIMWSVSPFGSDELAWAASREGPETRIGFAGWWFLYVGRPVFSGLLAGWVWRLFVGWRLIRSISRLDLRLVPTHPDQAGGLGFVQQVSIADAWIVLAISVVLAGRWAHEVLYHGVHVDSLKPLMAAYIVIVLLVFLGPLLLFSRNLGRFKRRAMLEYSALVGTQGQLVYRKWVHGEEVGDPPILDSPELSCVADTNTVFEAVQKMRTVPIGKQALIPLLLAVVVPILPVFAIEIPLKDLLLTIGGSLL
jgi:hypothetical protein